MSVPIMVRMDVSTTPSNPLERGMTTPQGDGRLSGDYRLSTGGRIGREMAAFALCLLASGCAPPPLTSNVLSGNATSSYLDSVQHANPTGADAAAVGLKIAIASRGDNTTDRLLARVNEAQGVCDRGGAMIRCVIDKSIVERSCFQGRCGDSRKRWTLSISWRDVPGVIDPQVLLRISWPERP
jgi:hypothetical protein